MEVHSLGNLILALIFVRVGLMKAHSSRSLTPAHLFFCIFQLFLVWVRSWYNKVFFAQSLFRQHCLLVDYNLQIESFLETLNKKGCIVAFSPLFMWRLEALALVFSLTIFSVTFLLREQSIHRETKDGALPHSSLNQSSMCYSTTASRSLIVWFFLE